MLNMTALKTSLEKEEKEVKKYALGVSLVVIAQVYFAVFLTKHLAENLTVLEALEKVGIFILLSYYFYSSSTKEKAKEPKTKRENPFLIGVTLSFLNMFAIPFFCGTVVTLDLFNLFNFDAFSVLFFVLGTSLGTFYILFLYGKYAKQIQKKAGKLIKDINLFLSVLTGLVALFMLLKLFF
jgi:threonine/homoserine/homoserine lactone efflux protein